MTGDEKFVVLLKAYTERHASDADLETLMNMIRTGDYDQLLKQFIYEEMQYNNTAAHSDTRPAADILQQILNAERHTDKLIPFGTPRPLKLWHLTAAAAVMIILLFVSVMAVRKKSVPEKIVKNETRSSLPIAGKPEKKYLRLQDGSTVLLNKGSHIDFPAVFTGNTREVTLVGEAYFDIRHNSERPFVVHTGQINTTVLGTAFNIRAYPGQQSVTVTVTRGRVQVSEHNRMLGIIIPNESLSVDMQYNSYKKETVNAEQVVEWKKKYLVLDSISFEAAAVLIETKYHVRISFMKESLKACHISATFMNDETLEQVLAVLTGVINATYKIQPNDQVIIGGEGCR